MKELSEKGKERMLKLADEYMKRIKKSEYERGYVDGYEKCEKTFGELKKKLGIK